jgi:hypothetical protein
MNSRSNHKPISQQTTTLKQGKYNKNLCVMDTPALLKTDFQFCSKAFVAKLFKMQI